jgi:hypothetical protein
MAAVGMSVSKETFELFQRNETDIRDLGDSMLAQRVEDSLWMDISLQFPAFEPIDRTAEGRASRLKLARRSE